MGSISSPDTCPAYLRQTGKRLQKTVLRYVASFCIVLSPAGIFVLFCLSSIPRSVRMLGAYSSALCWLALRIKNIALRMLPGFTTLDRYILVLLAPTPARNRPMLAFMSSSGKKSSTWSFDPLTCDRAPPLRLNVFDHFLGIPLLSVWVRRLCLLWYVMIQYYWTESEYWSSFNYYC